MKKYLLIALIAVSAGMARAGEPADVQQSEYELYTAIVVLDLHDIRFVVNGYLAQGYVPVGGFSTCWNGTQLLFTQAVAKRVYHAPAIDDR